MSGADGPNGTAKFPVPNYEWTYEYYDDEEPVSYEGLKADRCEYPFVCLSVKLMWS